MIISAIVATDKNRVIGKNNQIPWYLPADLKFFKKKTIHHHIIMGRNTFLSIGKPLPKRTNIVLSRNPFFTASGVIPTHSIEEALNIALQNDESEVFIIGGAQIYELSLPLLDRLYWTEVQIAVDGDTYFPEIDLNEWELASSEQHESDDRNEHSYHFNVYDKK